MTFVAKGIKVGQNVEDLEHSVSREVAMDLIKSIEEMGKQVLLDFQGKLNWQHIFDALPVLMGFAEEVVKTLSLSEKDKGVVAYLLIAWLVDNTDGWGPDGIIDPVIKVAARAFLVV